MMVPFEPRAEATVSVAASAVTNNVRFNDTSAFPGVPYLRVVNAGSVVAFVAFGGETVEASASTSVPIRPDSEMILRPGGSSYMAAVTAAGTATVYATPGYGGI